MTEEEESAQAWVDFVAGKFATREEAERALSEQGLCEDDSTYILDMIDMAYSRAVMSSVIGVPMKNMTSNVDRDPVFLAALTYFQRALMKVAPLPTPAEAAPAEERAPSKPWWKFW
jgi:hypothetical protein